MDGLSAQFGACCELEVLLSDQSCGLCGWWRLVCVLCVF